MPDLNAQGFADFFEALWDKPPFAWQRILAQRVLESTDAPWPEAIALPTAAGKTACLDIAVYALAAQADRHAAGQTLTAPRRIFFVVDRRVIVDEAFERACKLAKKLRAAEASILQDVADRLRQLAGGEQPLACYQLRGGMYRSDAWAKSPLQPTIIASTVDQLGSRLLFRAYGRSFKAWPIQAGLAGNDSLILLDEAHCAQPFLETLNAVKKYRGWAETPLPSPFHVVVMSATPPEGLADVFRDESDEPYDPAHPLGKRQKAAKPAKLVVADKAKGANANGEMAKALVKQAEGLASDHHIATVVFCNRVDTARRAHGLLAEKHGDNAILLTGRMRPIDKDDTVDVRLAPLSADASEDRELGASVFVVATQTLEVGANLDFDVLVTECASLDALRQRFGRLNRMGRPIQARAAVLVRADQAEKSDDDPVYDTALAVTWKWLKEHAGDTDPFDFGVSALAPRLDGADLRSLNAPTSHAPVMLPAHVDALVQTAPEPWPTPEVALFLHGPKSSAADVQVCWRADLTGTDEEAWKEAVTLCPPAAPECLPVPIGLMRRWLEGAADTAGPDVEGATEVEEPPARREKGTVDEINRHVIRWRGREEVEVVRDPRIIRPGDVVVIPASLQGWDVLAALGTDNPVADWGDRAYIQARGKAVLRLNPEVLKQWPQSRPCARLAELATDAQSRLDEDPDSLLNDVKAALLAVAEAPETPAWLKRIAENLSTDRKLGKGMILHPTGGLMLRGGRRIDLGAMEADSFSDEDDVSASGTVHSLLEEHLSGVAGFAERFARGCRLPEEVVGVISRAGLGHDLGKADPRFQAWLKGGNPWARGELLAKSGDMPQGRKASEDARMRAGYPKGGRHELLSIRLLESVPDLMSAEGPLRDLLLHLVEGHHGHCRPFAPVVEDEAPVDVSLEFRGQKLAACSATGLERFDSGVADRFWRLTRRYGWWGLAWLETILRLADHRRSEWEEVHLRVNKHD